MNRRQLMLTATLSTLTLMSVHMPSFAQSAPMFDSINMFIPAGPGGGWDSTGRAFEKAAKTENLVGNMQFENVGGAGGMVGLPRFVNQYKGKGNALLVGGSVMVGAGITNKSPLTIKNVVPIARLTEEASVIVVPAGGKIKTWKDLESSLKTNLRGTSVGGGSAGGTDHQVLGKIVKHLGGNPKEAAYVAFAGGGPATAAVIGGQVTAGISGYSEFEEHIKSGKMIALAVSGKNRIPGVDVPTLTELGTPVVLTNWRGIFAAPDISAADKTKLIDLAKKIQSSKSWKEELNTRKWVDAFATGADFEKDLAEDIKFTEELFKELGM